MLWGILALLVLYPLSPKILFWIRYFYYTYRDANIAAVTINDVHLDAQTMRWTPKVRCIVGQPVYIALNGTRAILADSYSMKRFVKTGKIILEMPDKEIVLQVISEKLFERKITSIKLLPDQRSKSQLNNSSEFKKPMNYAISNQITNSEITPRLTNSRVKNSAVEVNITYNILKKS